MTFYLYKYFAFIVDMNNIDIPKLRNIFAALANEKRLSIIELCSTKGYTITELSKKVGLNYSITVEYTSMLEGVALVKKERQDDRP